MKLRCVQNSIRIRVKKSDLAQLKKESIIKEHVEFNGNAVFTYALDIKETQSVYATLDKQVLSVHIPSKIAQNWINTNKVGIEVYNQLDNGSTLHILIEKDFPCVDRVDEDKSDTFFELASQKPDVC